MGGSAGLVGSIPISLQLPSYATSGADNSSTFNNSPTINFASPGASGSTSSILLLGAIALAVLFLVRTIL
jgi:hypothetical protein